MRWKILARCRAVFVMPLASLATLVLNSVRVHKDTDMLSYRVRLIPTYVWWDGNCHELTASGMHLAMIVPSAMLSRSLIADAGGARAVLAP
jgi:hypothetical protein